MNDSHGVPVPGKKNRVSLWRLAQKELRETLRDRRTIVTLVLMPLIVYPILSLVLRTFLFSNLGAAAEDNLIRYRMVVRTDWPEADVKDLFQILDGLVAIEKGMPLQANDTSDDESSDEDDGGEGDDAAATRKMAADLARRPEEAPLAMQDILLQSEQDSKAVDAANMISGGTTDLVIQLNGGPADLMRDQPLAITLVFSEDLPQSRRAAGFFREYIDVYNRAALQDRLRQNRISPALAIAAKDQKVRVENPPGTVSFASIIPLVLVLMTITGAVYPAIDLTAGERERGTLETLIATPAPRLKILVGKLVAVLTVAVLTATLNVIGMMSTVWAFQLDQFLLGGQPITLGIVLRIFGLLVLFATFFSALLLVVTSFARSFKEAQAYLIPIILMSFAPGLIAMTPGLELSGPLAVCPMINILLLARDILQGTAELVPASIAVFSTMVYATAAIGLAASIFGADSILYGSEGSWREMFLRPVEASSVAAPATGMLVLALLLPVNFVMIALMGKLGTDVTRQLALSAVFTALSFLVLPALVAWHQRVDFAGGFGLRLPRPLVLLVAVVLGLVMWPSVMSLIEMFHGVLEFFAGSEESSAWQERLVRFSQEQTERFRQAPVWIVVLAMAVVPAICEEWFFRGMLLRSLLGMGKPMWAIAGSAVAFGAFHTLSGSVVSFDRLIPTAMMGAVLGWIAWRTGSLLPGILLHMFHNATIALLARWTPELEKLPWFPESDQAVPGSWTVVSMVLTVLLLLTLNVVGQRRTESS